MLVVLVRVLSSPGRLARHRDPTKPHRATRSGAQSNGPEIPGPPGTSTRQHPRVVVAQRPRLHAVGQVHPRRSLLCRPAPPPAAGPTSVPIPITARHATAEAILNSSAKNHRS